MFTGIVEITAIVRDLRDGRLVIETPLAAGLRESGSVAVNGVCLTALSPSAATFSADLSPETLERTALGLLEPGALVNLERPLALGAELGGHLVQGHVDGTAEVVAYDRLNDTGNFSLTVRLPGNLLRYVAWKGSIALDGISLTVASL